MKCKRSIINGTKDIGIITKEQVGIVLCGLGGIGSIVESSMVLAIASGRSSSVSFGTGVVGFVVAALTIVGTVVIYKGRKLFGALMIFFSTLIGQLTGGAIGLALAIIIVSITGLPPPPIFNFGFLVSSWTFFGFLGSILVLFTIWKDKKKKC